LIGRATVILAVLAAGWVGREDVVRYASRWLGRERPADVELAAGGAASYARRVEAKIVALGQGRFDEVRLSVPELNAWIQGGFAGYFPDYVRDVRAAIEDRDRLQLSGRVTTGQVPGLERLGKAASLLPDTADVSIAGRLDGLAAGRGVYFVQAVQVGALPLPSAVRDQLIIGLRGGRAAELPANALPFELPRFVIDIGVRGDSVFLRRAPSGGG
jgi:hypothetical protein